VFFSTIWNITEYCVSRPGPDFLQVRGLELTGGEPRLEYADSLARTVRTVRTVYTIYTVQFEALERPHLEIGKPGLKSLALR